MPRDRRHHQGSRRGGGRGRRQGGPRCAIVASAQAVEHYEMCRYGTLIAWAGDARLPGRGALPQHQPQRGNRHQQQAEYAGDAQGREHQGRQRGIRFRRDEKEASGFPEASCFALTRRLQSVARRSGSDIRGDLTCMSLTLTRPTFSYLGGCRPGELSHSLMWEAVSARLAFSNNSSRSGHGGSALARSRLASACMRSLSSRGTVCLKRCRLVMTRSFPADKFMPIPRHAR